MARFVASTSASTDVSTGASSRAMERVEIVTRGGRRDYTVEEKAALLDEVALCGGRVGEVARRHGMCSSLLYRWRRGAEGRPMQRQAAPRPPRLVPLVIGPSVPAAVPGAVAPPLQETVGAAIEVVLRNGRVLRVGGEADMAAVARLAAALEA